MKFSKSDYSIMLLLFTILTTMVVVSLTKNNNVTNKQRIERKEVTLSDRYFEQSQSVVVVERDDGGLGTGFFVGTHIIATANHVVSGYDVVNIYLKGHERPIDGKVIEYSVDMDLALIEVATEQPNKPLKLTPRRQQVGQSVYVIGHPYGNKWSMSTGIISHINRKTMQRTLDGVIQIDAPINGGNSGGAVFDMNGDVIGVVSYGYECADGLGFIIPVKYLKSMVE